MTGQQTKRIAAIVALCNEISKLREHLQRFVRKKESDDSDKPAPVRRVG